MSLPRVAVRIIVRIMVVILWFQLSTLIATPGNVVKMIIPPSLHISSNIVQFVAISTFIVAASILIALYSSLSKVEPKSRTEAFSGMVSL